MTHDEWIAAVTLADARMKATRGHAYLTILKTRCQHCGRSTKDMRHCGRWFQTFVDELGRIVVERTQRDRQRDRQHGVSAT